MSEPMWLDGDDVALGIEPVCDNCDCRHDKDDDCDSGEPDVMWDDFFEDQEIRLWIRNSLSNSIHLEVRYP